MFSTHPNRLAIRLLLTTSLTSASTFLPNCTLPTHPTTLVSGANIRGTFDILWSGLFTIFICIWTVQHLNVPEQRNGRDQGWRGDLKWAWKGFYTKFKWMVFTLILPEFLLAKAIAERTVIIRSMEKVKALKGADGQSLPEAEISTWSKAHIFYAEMGGFVIRPYGPDTTRTKVVATADILMLRRKGFLSTLPGITEEHLNDLSNGDQLTKAVAIGQVSWMVVQVIVRAAKGLPSTQLEITACAFAASTLLTYLLWWEKPQAVRSITELSLSAYSVDQSGDLESYLSKSGRVNGLGYFIPSDLESANGDLKDNEYMTNDSLSKEVDDHFIIGIMVGGIVLGGVQCAAWNFDFPTTIESQLWRWSSVATVAVIPGMYAFIWPLAQLNESVELEWIEKTGTSLSYTACTLYFVARLFIVFETIYSLFHLPPAAFVSTWSSNIPHIA